MNVLTASEPPAIDLRRARLLDAANRVVLREGPDVSMNAIAAEAGITKPILYRHFADKGALYQALAERHTDELLTRLRAALTSPGSLRDRTRTTIETYLSAIEERPQVYQFLSRSASGEEPDVRGQVAGFTRRVADELAAGLRGELGLTDPAGTLLARTWAHAITGMVLGVGDWWLRRRELPRAVVVDQLTDLLWGAFGRAREEPGQPEARSRPDNPPA